MADLEPRDHRDVGGGVAARGRQVRQPPQAEHRVERSQQVGAALLRAPRPRIATAGGARETWDEVTSLVHSDDSAENGDHYAVETDERRRTERITRTFAAGSGISRRSPAEPKGLGLAISSS